MLFYYIFQLFYVIFFFFFQAEDGIRDWSVTGVQTCALPIYPNSVFQDRCTGETAVSTKRGFESSTSWCSAGDIQCRILHLKPRGLPVLTTTGIESPKNLLNSLVCNAYEIRPGKGDRRFSEKKGRIWV